MSGFELSPEQERGRSAVLQWFRNPNRTKQWFFLNGSAGTGKSSCTVATIESIKGKVLFAAPTAKAALVMSRKGCQGAQTIHSLIYKPKGVGGNKAAIHKMEAELKTLDPNTDKARLLAKELKKLLEGVKPMFSLNLDSALREASLLVVDEVSMVDHFTMQDLLSFNIPILVQGDLWQLPPIGGKNFFKDIPADYTLTQIHRQAADSPVIHLATLARDKKPIPLGNYGDSFVTNDKSKVDALSHDQIIVGKNTTRHATNEKVRMLRGFIGEMPNPGETVICKNNNRELGLTNGDIFKVDSFDIISNNVGIIGVTNEELSTRVICHTQYFVGKEPDPWEKKKRECFSFGYCATAHACQGSEYPSVYMVDQSRYFPGIQSLWKYTGISRASDRITILST